ncbi:endo-1,4-beta-xylanase [Cellulomonas palmilytica]|uniref:endo-1,4-beta-xylanase n=1 Tax=Cellulomonas palmilytica TaxID=2608402 RepID=UPI001F2A113B|nr:endo-1,4-beta-xylanase [Cellulomonas palmilytica]UJP41365.1 endo-1,4-beta-xylanase [Cellulomonas palmilytica]
MSPTPTRRRVSAWTAVSALVLSSLTAVAAATSASADDVTLLSTDFSDSSWEETWQASGSPSLSVVDVDGNPALKVSGRTADYVGIQSAAGTFTDLVPGSTYTFSMKARLADDVAGSTGVRLVMKPAYDWIGNTTMSAGAWTTVSGSFTVPAGAATGDLQVYVGTADITGLTTYDYLVDDITVTGQPAAPQLETILSTDFSDESWSTSWRQSGSATLSVVDVDDNPALLVAGRGADYVGIETVPGALAALQPGKSYTFTGKARLADGVEGSTGVRFVMKPAYDWIGNTTMSAGEWTTISGVFTVPADTSELQLYVGTADITGLTTYDYLLDDLAIVGEVGGDDYVETDPDFVPGGALSPSVTPVTSARGTDKTSALTFDDGPNGATTTELLDFLEENDVKATFCVIGQNVQAPGGADVLKRIVADGHTLCNHSTDYNGMGSLTKAQVADKLKANLAIIRDALGDPEAEVPYFRAPNGDWGKTNQVAVALGMQPLAVTNLVMDWDGAENAGDEAKLTAALRDVITSNPGEIVLVHDGGGDRTAGVNAVKTVVAELLEDGWTFTLPAGGAAPKGVTLVESDFEDGTLQGWTARDDGNGVPTLTVQDEVAHESTYAARVSDRASQGQGLQFDVTDTATPGASYDVSAWIKFEGTPGDMTLSARTATGDGQSFSNLAQFTGLSSSQWVNVTGTFTMPAFADAAELYFETKWDNGAAGNTSTFVIDDISVKSTPVSEIQDLTPLKDTVEFPTGVAIDSREMNGSASQLLLKHFNQVTAENYMKVEAWYSGTSVDTFRMHPEAKALLDYAQENGLRVYGHVLVWHSQTPDWFYRDAEGELLDAEAMRQRQREHIFNVAEAIADEYGPFGSDTNPLVAWDVVNEVIDDGTSYEDGMRRSTWYQILGESFVDSAFEYANEAFNDVYAAEGAEHPVTLFINDYNTEQTGKRARYKALVERLIARDVPIDGVGHQFHVALSTPVSTLGAALDDFEGMTTASGADLEQAVTELDVFVGSADAAKSVDQGYYLKAAFDSFRAHSDSLFSVTLWGLTDGRSWRASNNGKPLLFDDYFKAKPAYYGAAGLELPAAIRSANAFAADADGDYSVGSDEWRRLPLHQVGEIGKFQLRWTPDGLVVFVDVDDATADSGDAVLLETPDGVVTVARGSSGAVERDGGWSVVTTLPLTDAANGDVVELDVRVVDQATTSAWNTPGVLGSVTLVEALSFTEVPATTTAPTIDGDVDAVWSGAGSVTTEKVTSGANGAQGTFRTLWKDNTLYVLADVTDPEVDTTGSDPWTKDSVELYVDGGNFKNGAYRYDDTQIRIDATGAVSFGTGDETFQRNRLTSAVVPTATGYRVEAAISLLEYGGLGTFHGLDFQVNDAAGGSRHAITNWADPTGTGYQSTARWGVGKLVAALEPPAETAPVVTTHPATTTGKLNSTVTFTAAATGNPTPTVQWQRKLAGTTTWTNLAGRRGTSLTVKAVEVNDKASFRAVFTNKNGTAYTRNAQLKVERVAPKVTVQPKSVTAPVRSVVKVTAQASGYPTPQVQWERKLPGSSSWTKINGATKTTVSVTLTPSVDGVQMRAVFKNSAGTVTTKAATVTAKKVAPTITSQPTSVVAKSGTVATFTVTTTGYPAPKLQWYVQPKGSTKWFAISGATGSTLRINATASRDGSAFRAVATNAAGKVTSKAALLTLR